MPDSSFLHGPVCTCAQIVEGEVTVRGRRVRFEFSQRFGPTVLDRYGDPKDKQPVYESHPFWKPFNAWLEQHLKTHA